MPTTSQARSRPDTVWLDGKPYPLAEPWRELVLPTQERQAERETSYVLTDGRFGDGMGVAPAARSNAGFAHYKGSTATVPTGLPDGSRPGRWLPGPKVTVLSFDLGATIEYITGYAGEIHVFGGPHGMVLDPKTDTRSNATSSGVGGLAAKIGQPAVFTAGGVTRLYIPCGPYIRWHSYMPRNLVTNSSFESNTTGWGAASTLSRVQDVPAYDGAWVLKSEYNGSPDTNFGAINVTLSGVADFNFNARVWIPSAWDGGAIRMAPGGFTGATTSNQVDADLSKRDQWQRISVTLTPAAGGLSGSLVIRAVTNPTTGKSIYIDAVEVTRGRSPLTVHTSTDGAAAGGYAQVADDTTDDRDLALHFWTGRERLYMGGVQAKVRNATSDPTTLSNWAPTSGERFSDPGVPITGGIEYADTCFVGKEDGLWAFVNFADNDFGAPAKVVGGFPQHPDNCRHMGLSPWGAVMVPTLGGSMRYAAGRVRHVGLEANPYNRSGLIGRPVAYAAWGPFLFESRIIGSDSYILRGRLAEGQAAGIGEVQWEYWVKIPNAQCRALYVDTSTDPPRLWFGYGQKPAYVKLTLSPDDSAYEATGEAAFVVLPALDGGTPGVSKAFRKWELTTRGTGASDSVTPGYQLDRSGTFTDLSAVTAPGRASRFFPQGATGSIIEPRVTIDPSAASSRPAVDGDMTLRLSERPETAEEFTLPVLLEPVPDIRESPTTMLANLKALAEAAAPVTLRLPDDRQYTVVVEQPVQAETRRQQGREEPRRVVSVRIRVLEYA